MNIHFHFSSFKGVRRCWEEVTTVSLWSQPAEQTMFTFFQHITRSCPGPSISPSDCSSAKETFRSPKHLNYYYLVVVLLTGILFFFMNIFKGIRKYYRQYIIYYNDTHRAQFNSCNNSLRKYILYQRILHFNSYNHWKFACFFHKGLCNISWEINEYIPKCKGLIRLPVLCGGRVGHQLESFFSCRTKHDHKMVLYALITHLRHCPDFLNETAHCK